MQEGSYCGLHAEWTMLKESPRRVHTEERRWHGHARGWSWQGGRGGGMGVHSAEVMKGAYLPRCHQTAPNLFEELGSSWICCCGESGCRSHYLIHYCLAAYTCAVAPAYAPPLHLAPEACRPLLRVSWPVSRGLCQGLCQRLLPELKPGQSQQTRCSGRIHISLTVLIFDSAQQPVPRGLETNMVMNRGVCVSTRHLLR